MGWNASVYKIPGVYDYQSVLANYKQACEWHLKKSEKHWFKIIEQVTERNRNSNISCFCAIIRKGETPVLFERFPATADGKTYCVYDHNGHYFKTADAGMKFALMRGLFRANIKKHTTLEWVMDGDYESVIKEFDRFMEEWANFHKEYGDEP